MTMGLYTYCQWRRPQQNVMQWLLVVVEMEYFPKKKEQYLNNVTIYFHWLYWYVQEHCGNGFDIQSCNFNADA